MKRASLGKTMAVLMLACAGIQALSGTGLLAGALVLSLHWGAHEHELSLVPEGGHLDLVVSHPAPRATGASDRTGLLISSGSAGDHVLHLESNDALNSLSSRGKLAASPALVLATAYLQPLAPGFAVHRSTARGDGFDAHARSTVLRL